MKGQTLARPAGVLLLLLASFPSRADEVDGLIGSLKPSPLDYTAWAERLLKAADGLAAKPQAQGRVYEKAYEYGLQKARGRAVAVKAARALLKLRPKERPTWQRKLLGLLELDWRTAGRARKDEAGRVYLGQLIAAGDDLLAAGKATEAQKRYTEAFGLSSRYAPALRDEITGRTQDVRAWQKLQRTLGQCKRMLARKPKDVALRERLILLYVVELDDPAEARKLLTPDVSEELRTCVPLAAGKADRLAKEACVQLGDWYRKLADRPGTGRARTVALTRVKTYYERFLKLEANALQAVTAKTKLREVENELREPKVSEGPGWTDLLARKRQLKQTKAKVTPEGLRIGKLETVQAVSVPFTAEFIAKTDSIEIRIGYRERGVVILSWELNQDELRIADFATGEHMGFKGRGRVPRNEWVRVVLDVTDAHTEVFVDGQSRTRVAGTYKGLAGKLSIYSSHGSVVTVKAFRVRQGRRGR
ncbi:MAG TPA: hypothetical protein VM031_02105 [Phycisphaerae bacterium]|nr:hypothetical protein [Phycisphaerae bacterium]